MSDAAYANAATVGAAALLTMFMACLLVGMFHYQVLHLSALTGCAPG
jgi:hypothetical protein